MRLGLFFANITAICLGVLTSEFWTIDPLPNINKTLSEYASIILSVYNNSVMQLTDQVDYLMEVGVKIMCIFLHLIIAKSEILTARSI